MEEALDAGKFLSEIKSIQPIAHAWLLLSYSFIYPFAIAGSKVEKESMVRKRSTTNTGEASSSKKARTKDATSCSMEVEPPIDDDHGDNDSGREPSTYAPSETDEGEYSGDASELDDEDMAAMMDLSDTEEEECHKAAEADEEEVDDLQGSILKLLLDEKAKLPTFKKKIGLLSGTTVEFPAPKSTKAKKKAGAAVEKWSSAMLDAVSAIIRDTEISESLTQEGKKKLKVLSTMFIEMNSKESRQQHEQSRIEDTSVDEGLQKQSALGKGYLAALGGIQLLFQQLGIESNAAGEAQAPVYLDDYFMKWWDCLRCPTKYSKEKKDDQLQRWRKKMDAALAAGWAALGKSGDPPKCGDTKYNPAILGVALEIFLVKGFGSLVGSAWCEEDQTYTGIEKVLLSQLPDKAALEKEAPGLTTHLPEVQDTSTSMWPLKNAKDQLTKWLQDGCQGKPPYTFLDWVTGGMIKDNGVDIVGILSNGLDGRSEKKRLVQAWQSKGRSNSLSTFDKKDAAEFRKQVQTWKGLLLELKELQLKVDELARAGRSDLSSVQLDDHVECVVVSGKIQSGSVPDIVSTNLFSEH